MQANNKSMIAFNIKSTTDWLTGQISHRRSLWEASSCTQRNSCLKTRPNKNKKQEWEGKCVGQAHSLTPTATNLGSSTTLCYKPPCWPHAWSLHTQVGKQLGSVTVTTISTILVYFSTTPCSCKLAHLTHGTCIPKWENSWVASLSLTTISTIFLCTLAPPSAIANWLTLCVGLAYRSGKTAG